MKNETRQTKIIQRTLNAQVLLSVGPDSSDKLSMRVLVEMVS